MWGRYTETLEYITVWQLAKEILKGKKLERTYNKWATGGEFQERGSVREALRSNLNRGIREYFKILRKMTKLRTKINTRYLAVKYYRSNFSRGIRG